MTAAVEGRTAGRPGLRAGLPLDLLAEVGLALVSLAAVFGLRRLFVDGSFFVPVAAQAVGAHVVVTVARRRRMPTFLAIVVTAFVALVAIAIAFQARVDAGRRAHRRDLRPAQCRSAGRVDGVRRRQGTGAGAAGLLGRVVDRGVGRRGVGRLGGVPDAGTAGSGPALGDVVPGGVDPRVRR